MSSITSTPPQSQRVALVTGGSRGFGRAVAVQLAANGWHIVIDGRDPSRLDSARAAMPNSRNVVAIAGDVADAQHRQRLAAAVVDAGGLDLLVNNASLLGPSPQPRLAGYPLDALQRVLAVNVIAPLALFQQVLPQLDARGGCVVNLTSDAAAEPYEGWGGYGTSKAALDQMSAILGIEHPRLRIYAFDPGDMNTDMHQEAFPGEDITDRPAPETVVPALLRLVDGSLPSGRYRASELTAAVAP